MFTIRATRDGFENKRRSMLASGIQVPAQGDTGDINLTQFSVKLRFWFNEGANTLTLEVTDKPFLVPEAVVEHKIREWFAT